MEREIRPFEPEFRIGDEIKDLLSGKHSYVFDIDRENRQYILRSYKQKTWYGCCHEDFVDYDQFKMHFNFENQYKLIHRTAVHTQLVSLDKVCEYLDKNIFQNYTYNAGNKIGNLTVNNKFTNKEEFLNTFRKTMGEE